MTFYIPLDASTAHPNAPSFLVPSPSPAAHLTTVIHAILKAKRIAVVCGAGISVEAGIPDFRSPDGLFQSLKRDNPKEALSSGKDLFDTSVFKSEQKTALFYRMIARLSSLSSQGQPTPFHRLLRNLDDRGQLLRVYTQNIDALEMKAGLSFGVPVFEEKELRVKLKGKAKVRARDAGSGTYSARLGGRKALASHPPSASPGAEADAPAAGPSRRATPSDGDRRASAIPRCIPLHGTLLTLHCQHCTQSFPLRPPAPPAAPPPSPPSDDAAAAAPPPSLHALLARGTPPLCPSCTALEETRALVGKRLRGVGRLRPSVVLYGEEHREGEGVGEAVRRDLCGVRARGPDLLLVVGTSLRVPGTKRIVREFAKAVRPPPPPPCAGARIQTVFLNLDFPAPAREWEGVFDAWVGGDVQAFARAVERVMQDEAARGPPGGRAHAAKRAAGAAPETPPRPAKRRRADADLPPTPVSLPRPSAGRVGRTPKPPPPPGTPRKVILRLPPPPPPRKRSIPEVVITTTPAMFARRPPARSPSPLTPLPSPSSSSSSSLSSLSSLTPPPIARTPVAVWRSDIGEKLGAQKRVDVVLGSESDEDVPLAVAVARRRALPMGYRRSS